MALVPVAHPPPDAREYARRLGSPDTEVAQVAGTHSAFAAMKTDGSVVTWGWATDGGDSATVRELFG